MSVVILNRTEHWLKNVSCTLNFVFVFIAGYKVEN